MLIDLKKLGGWMDGCVDGLKAVLRIAFLTAIRIYFFRRVAQKVAELLDSFRPGGTYCYRPFYKGFKVYRNMPDDNNNTNINHNNNNSEANNNNSNNSSDLESNINVNNNLAQNQDSIVETEPNTPGPNMRLAASENARRRLYLDLDRPRPFYGRSNPQGRSELTSIADNDFYLVQDSVRHSDPKSLQVSPQLGSISQSVQVGH